MKRKINLATGRVRNIVTVSCSFLAIIRGISAADVETQVSTPSTGTIPHGAVGSSQPFINYSPISELASQSSNGEPLPGEKLPENKEATPKSQDIALPNEPTCEALPPVKTPLPIVVSGSQGGAD